jgi:hypothetical protein
MPAQLAQHVLHHRQGGLEQRMQQNGSVSLSTTGLFQVAANDMRGSSTMASSGHVVSHRPHWTQFFSTKRSCGMVPLKTA